jgi:hypothetical protein
LSFRILDATEKEMQSWYLFLAASGIQDHVILSYKIKDQSRYLKIHVISQKHAPDPEIKSSPDPGSVL